MHTVIYSLVEASTRDEALATGKTVFDRLVGASLHADAVFDYYVTFDESGTSVAGKARWGDLPVAVPVESDDGQKLLERGWEATKSEFKRNLDRVRDALEELSDEEIMRDDGLARHAFQYEHPVAGEHDHEHAEFEKTLLTEVLWTALDRLFEEKIPTLADED
ncbi:hypothetical protein [Halorussus aquaticus]|uniref:DUF7995 domain-containing protein n=1 Tax=Halorussus aquaticus TaxID=2953748 RepID=A0ABD5Q964_9EURY|nr:hypothetical protein [Halorussus aquaticus]